MKRPNPRRGAVGHAPPEASDAMRTKTITTDREYENALARIEKLMDDAKPDTPQGNELERLVRSAEDYEDQVYPVPKPTRTKMLAAATVRGFKVVKELQKAEDGAWSGAALRKRLGLDLADLRRRRNAHRIVYWRGANRAFFYPKWQFTDKEALLPGIREILKTFQSRDEWRIMRYFLGARLNLGGRRPLDLLRAGDTEKILDHAGRHAEDNTW